MGLISFVKLISVCYNYVRWIFAVLDGLKYASSHEWVKHEGHVATIGITHHAQVILYPDMA
jgi:glycine cleavage system H protein